MTQIQIDWSRVKETNRHNVATELQAANELNETIRHNVVTEDETKRHNMAGENETNRHNLVTEKQEDKRIAETKRHNTKTESQEDKRISETKRHNTRTESQEDKRISETKRHNTKTEKQKDSEISISAQKAAAEVRLNDARSQAQELVNYVNRSDPEMFKAKTFIDVLKTKSPLLYTYLGLNYASKEQKQLLNGVVNGTDRPEEYVTILNNLHKQLFNKDLDSKTKTLLNNTMKSVVLHKGSTQHVSNSRTVHGGNGNKLPGKNTTTSKYLGKGRWTS